MKLETLDLHAELKKHFGFSKFKGLQEDIINSLLAKEDTFVIMPTGGGKSMCYQLPALLLEGTAIVVSPLIALMKNQVDAIRGISERDGVAHVLNSSLNKTQVAQVKSDIQNGITKLLYVAPESLTKQDNIDFLSKEKISFFAIDEAHCISEWGHDFRPEYRNIRKIMEQITDVPIIALTATATPKVQEDIMKNLGMSGGKVYKSSFNRANLFYEIKPKVNVQKQLVKFIKENEGKSGIIYCLSRKSVGNIAELLQVNGFNALPYHAGLDAKTRAKHQDMFLMEDVEIIVATIAFGMGIDKPDVRYVIHYDMPKSLESYYQETGRAGRDGGEGHCLAFYDYKDIEKLEKFMSGKPVAEQEIGYQLLQEVVAYAETSMSRRKFLLHYFGEEFDEVNGEGADMDDNIRNPKKKIEAKEDAIKLLKAIQSTKEIYKIKDIVSTLIGIRNALITSHKTDELDVFGSGDDKDGKYWTALARQIIVNGYLRKDIETYGVLKLTEKGKDYINSPTSFMMVEDHNYDNLMLEGGIVTTGGRTAALDEKLLNHLKEIRKDVAKKKGVPPYAVLQETSLNEMAFRYPITLDELKNIPGVGDGKANKFGKAFVDFIAKYVEENDIERLEDMVVKSVVQKSGNKVYIISNLDRKLPLEEIAANKSLSVDDLVKEMESIVYSGTKLDISYILEEFFDEDEQEEIMDYFMEADSDDLIDAINEFDGDYDEEEMRLIRIRFISEVAN